MSLNNDDFMDDAMKQQKQLAFIGMAGLLVFFFVAVLTLYFFLAAAGIVPPIDLIPVVPYV